MARTNQSTHPQYGARPEKEEPELRLPPRPMPFWEVIAEIGAEIPNEMWATVPDDWSINYRHYLSCPQILRFAQDDTTGLSTPSRPSSSQESRR